MLCDKCKSKEARIYYTEIVGGKKIEQHLCEDCAAELTSFQKDIPLESILSGLFSMNSGNESICSRCGMSYQEFRRVGKFGCASCYKTFGRFLQGNLKRIQGAAVHTGKVPASLASRQLAEAEKNIIAKTGAAGTGRPEKDMARRLEQQLKEAVREEKYEEAARLRDQLREMRLSEEKGVGQECRKKD